MADDDAQLFAEIERNWRAACDARTAVRIDADVSAAMAKLAAVTAQRTAILDVQADDLFAWLIAGERAEQRRVHAAYRRRQAARRRRGRRG